MFVCLTHARGCVKFSSNLESPMRYSSPEKGQAFAAVGYWDPGFAWYADMTDKALILIVLMGESCD